MEVTLPNNWTPRPYQRKIWGYLESGGKRAIAVWHRRAGKDDVCLHWAATAAFRRVGNYWHMLPEADQARKAIWEAVNPHTGIKRIDEAFPHAIRESTVGQQMLIRFKNGSTWQIVGSDNYNSLVGAPPVGLVFSEYALADPAAWSYLRPILRENGGWALFIYTPRGKNHGATLFDGHKDDPEWFVEKLAATETSVFSATDLATEEAEYIKEFGPDDGKNRYRQEYLCDFNAAVVGSYFGSQFEYLDQEKRIGKVPWEPAIPVVTAWDLGIGDSTAIWFAQVVGREVRLIDYYENSGVGLDHYANVLRGKRYVYGDHYLPHDSDVSELGTGKTRVAVLRELGINPIVLPRGAVDDGINAARMLLPMCWFDAEKCERGIEALRQYRREFDDKLKVFKQRPLHDWTSHAADALRYLAVGLPDRLQVKPKPDRYTRRYSDAGSWMSA